MSFLRSIRRWQPKPAKLTSSGWKLVSRSLRKTTKACSNTLSTIGKWWKHRHLKHLLRGLPALLLLAGAAWLLVVYRSVTLFERGQVYLKAGRRAIAAEDWENARLYLGRAIGLGIDSSDIRFQLAQAAQECGDESRMVAILSELAPADRPIHAASHIWQATQLLPKPSAENVELAVRHLEHALTLQPDSRSAHSLLGDLAYQLQDWPVAIRHLEQSDPVSARNNLQLSKALLLTGNMERARTFAKRAEIAGRKECESAPKSVDSLVALAESLLLQERFEEAHQVVTKGINQAPDNQQLRQELGRVYLVWSEVVADSEKDSIQRDFKTFQLLARALEQDPNSIQIFDRIMKLMLASGILAERAEQILLENISNGIVPGVSHLLLGTFSDATNEPEKAAFHLERANALLSNAPIVANNLAWHLMSRKGPDLARAMTLIDSVIEKHPQNPAFRETRGQILMRLGQYQEALEELEFALPSYREEPELHKSLAIVYENLGQPKLAERHKIIGQRLSEAKSGTAPKE